MFAVDGASVGPELAEVLLRLPAETGFQEVGKARRILDGMR